MRSSFVLLLQLCSLVSFALTDTVKVRSVTDSLGPDLKLVYNRIDDRMGKKQGSYEKYYKSVLVEKGKYVDGQRDSTWEFYNLDKEIIMTGKFNKGEQDGEWFYYYPDGKPASIVEFKNGLRTGNWVGYFKDGKEAVNMTYVNDTLEGKYVTYYDNRQPYFEAYYVHGTPEGHVKRWYKSGQLMEDKVVHNGKLDSVYVSFYESGQAWEEIEYRDGNVYNIRKYFDVHGKPLSYGKIVNGTGKVKLYDERARVNEKVAYVNGKRQGKATYYSNGKITSTGNFYNDLKAGEWKYYTNGVLQSKINYSYGKLNGHAKFYENGALSEEGEYVDDKAEGIWTSYDPGKVVYSKITFRKGKREGKATYYASYGYSKVVTYRDDEKTGDPVYYEYKMEVSSNSYYSHLMYTNYQYEYAQRTLTAPHSDSEDDSYSTSAQFPGGNESGADYLKRQRQYPEQARLYLIQGIVHLAFTISTTGEIKNIDVTREVGMGCDEEAIRLLEIMPVWTPALENGIPVSSRFTMTVGFFKEREESR